MAANRWLLASAALVALAGCASGAPDKPAVTASPTLTASAAALGLPERVAGATVLKEISPTSGDQAPGAITAKAGDLWVSTGCQGDGTLRVELSPGMALEIPCQADKAKYSTNKDESFAGGTLDVRVTAPESVRWSLRIEQ